MANGVVPSKGPNFPFSVLISWFGIFCAVVALVTIWTIRGAFLIKVLLTALFALVPLAIIIFWLGRFFEHRRTSGGEDGEAPEQ